MKIYTLIEDSRKRGSGFLFEHGLSLYFELRGRRILFDTGASGSFIYNATLLGIDLSRVDICVISHAHNDHAGGLSYFLDINKDAKVYMKSAAQGDYYVKKLFKTMQCGIDPAIFKQYADRIVLIDDDTPLAPGITVANVNQHRHLPAFCSLMVKNKSGRLEADDLSHELFLAVDTGDGTVVLTGCSHHGLINILMTASEKFGRVDGVVGGFHLDGCKSLGVRWNKEPAAEIRAIAKYLNQNRIRSAYTGHCTGEKPFEKLELLSRVKKIRSGDVINLP